MPAKFLSSWLMVTLLMAFLSAGEAHHGNFMPTFLRDVIRIAAFLALANSAMHVLPGYWGSLYAVRRLQQAHFAVRYRKHHTFFSAAAPDDWTVCFWSSLKMVVTAVDTVICLRVA